MHVELISENAPVLLPQQDRSDGIHVSELIHEMAIRLGHYKEREADEAPNQCMFELGNAWEWALIRRMELEHPGRYVRGDVVGELECEGVFGHPDLLEPHARIDHEMKVTWKSLNSSGPGTQHFWKYETQAKAYCYMLGGWTKAQLHVAYVNGDYGWVRGGEPKWRTWAYTFTQHELEANWRMLMRLVN